MKNKVERCVGEFITNGIERLVGVRELPEGFVDQYFSLVQESQRPLPYANHQSYADGFALAKLVRRLQRIAPIKGFVLPVASSFVSGHQNENAGIFYRLTKAPLEARGLKTVPYTRDVDSKYDQQKDSDQLRDFIKFARDGYSFALLPEASMEGGRHPKDSALDQINGMQEFDPENITAFFNLLNRGSRRSFFVPVGIHGTYRVWHPTYHKPQQDIYPTLFGISSRTVVEVNVGMPVTSDILQQNLGSQWKNDRFAVTRFLMEQVAGLVPDQARGKYKSSSVGVD